MEPCASGSKASKSRRWNAPSGAKFYSRGQKKGLPEEPLKLQACWAFQKFSGCSEGRPVIPGDCSRGLTGRLRKIELGPDATVPPVKGRMIVLGLDATVPPAEERVMLGLGATVPPAEKKE